MRTKRTTPRDGDFKIDKARDLGLGEYGEHCWIVHRFRAGNWTFLGAYPTRSQARIAVYDTVNVRTIRAHAQRGGRA